MAWGALATLLVASPARAERPDTSNNEATTRLASASPTMIVAAKDRDVVAYAYQNSPTFRDLYDRLAAQRHVTVWLESAPRTSLAPAAALGLTRWISPPSIVHIAGQAFFRGATRCLARIAGARDLASSFAHELAHAEELARYGSILRAPGVRPSWNDSAAAETEHALAVGAAVWAELAGRSLRDLAEVRAWLFPQAPARAPQLAERLPEDAGVGAAAGAAGRSRTAARGLLNSAS